MFNLLGMRAKICLLTSTGKQRLSFPSVILASSLFGFFWPQHTNAKDELHHLDFQVQRDSQDASLRRDHSPGWGPLNIRWDEILKFNKADR
jgi:hypothetical protein